MSSNDLTAFGISPSDEGVHHFGKDYEWWNESVFYDWYDAAGTHAGHCRIGWLPNQERLWFWLFLFNGAEWVAIEEPRLPLSRCFRNSLPMILPGGDEHGIARPAARCGWAAPARWCW